MPVTSPSLTKDLILTTLLVLAGMTAWGQTVTPLSTSTPIAGGSTK